MICARDLRVEDARRLVLVALEHVAGAIVDLEDAGRRILDAVVGEDAVRARHLQEVHLAAAEHEREPVLRRIAEGRDAERLRGIDGVLDAREVEDLDGRRRCRRWRSRRARIIGPWKTPS